MVKDIKRHVFFSNPQNGPNWFVMVYVSIGSKKLYCRVSVCVVVCRRVIYVSTGSKKLDCCVSVCVVMCRQVVYVSVGSRKIVSLCVGVCRHVSAGCVGVCR